MNKQTDQQQQQWEVAQLGAQVQHHDQRISEVERQLRDITAERCPGSRAASSAASSEPHPEPARGAGGGRFPMRY